MAEYPERLQHGSGATLTLEPGLAVVSIKPSAAVTTADIEDVLASAGLVPVASEQVRRTAPAGPQGRPMSRINDSDRLRWVRLPEQQALPSAAASIQTQLGDRAEWLGAVYRFPG